MTSTSAATRSTPTVHILYTYTGGLYWANGTPHWVAGAHHGDFTGGIIGPRHLTMRHGVLACFAATCGDSEADVNVRV